METQPTRQCDVNDLICQANALAHLKGLQSTLGEGKFTEEFPELQGLGVKIAAREATFKESLQSCGIDPSVIDLTVISTEPVKEANDETGSEIAPL